MPKPDYTSLTIGAIAQVDSIRERAYFEAISPVATGRHPLHDLLEHVERFHRIPARGMRCASTKPGTVGPIDERCKDWPQVNPSTGRRAAVDRLETVIALRAARVSRGSNRGPAILQLGD